MENKLVSFRPAGCFEEAYPIGNGHLGAMIYGRYGVDKISLNADTLWTGSKDKENKVYQKEKIFDNIRKMSVQGKNFESQKLIEDEFLCENADKYLPAGNIVITETERKADNYFRILDLRSGMAYVQYTVDDCEIHKEYFVSKNEGIIAARFLTSKQGFLNFDLLFETQLELENENYVNNIYIAKGRCPIIVDDEYKYDDKSRYFACTVMLKLKSGAQKYVNGKIEVRNADYAEVYIKLYSGNSEIDDNQILSDFNKVLSYEVIKEKHIADFGNMYNRTLFALNGTEKTEETEKRIRKFDGTDIGLCELLFNFGKYLIISASQGGSEAMNLQGIWNEELVPPWGSGYTLNINTEMNYWPVNMCNLTECFEPLVRLTKRIAKNGRYIAEKLYGAEGFVCHHNTDNSAHSQPVGKNGENAAAYGYWFMGSGWLACQIFDAYEYSMDSEILKNELYPIMKAALKFYLSIMTKDNDGKYILCPSTSPENFYISNNKRVCVSKYTTMSQSIFMNLAEKVIKSCEILGTDTDFKSEVENVYKNIKVPEISSDGRIMEWAGEQVEDDTHHRHVSHLYFLYPGEQINPLDNNEYCDACKKTLEMRGDGGTGWSLAWKANLWARLHCGEKAYKLLKRQLMLVDPNAECDYGDAGGTYANMFCAHPPFQIDGNLGIMSAIINMIVQKYDERIVLLPALPDEWKNGRLDGIRLKGNIFVDIIWEDNALKTVNISSPIEQTVELIYGNMSKKVLTKPKQKMEIDF